jgi:hypothetical protein
MAACPPAASIRRSQQFEPARLNACGKALGKIGVPNMGNVGLTFAPLSTRMQPSPFTKTKDSV